MTAAFGTLLETAIIPQVVQHIVEQDGVSELQAIDRFYQSRTYALLSDEATGIWHYSPLALYKMWADEQDGQLSIAEEQS